MIVPVILAGGTGSRLWPLSRARTPKPLLGLGGDRTMLQETLLRLESLRADALGEPVVVCSEQHRFQVAEQLAEIGTRAEPLILEPLGRDTAAAIGVAALAALERAEDALILALPADHRIPQVERFIATVRAALPVARDGRLVTFGVVPTSAETGYGYICAGDAIVGAEAGGAREIERFEEKPDAETARAYASSGRHLWNSGMFLFRADRYLEELERSAPKIARGCREAFARGRRERSELFLDAAAFERCPARSVDYAVMEHTRAGAVLPLDAGWSDIGSFTALAESLVSDADGNALVGDVLVRETTGTLVHAESRLVTTLGLRDQVVIETSDAVLVASKERAQDVRALVQALEKQSRPETEHAAEVERPWGSFRSLGSGPGFQVKRLRVRPGGVLSLQRHQKRREHWVVVAGTARVTVGNETRDLGVGESVDVPLGATHRLANPGEGVMDLVEVQLGAYLGEDDIERIEDAYGREGTREG